MVATQSKFIYLFSLIFRSPDGFDKTLLSTLARVVSLCAGDGEVFKKQICVLSNQKV